LFHQRKADGQPLTIRTQSARLVHLRKFGRWLEREGHGNPRVEMNRPCGGHHLPKTWLTAAEARPASASPDRAISFGTRHTCATLATTESATRNMRQTSRQLSGVPSICHAFRFAPVRWESYSVGSGMRPKDRARNATLTFDESTFSASGGGTFLGRAIRCDLPNCQFDRTNPEGKDNAQKHAAEKEPEIAHMINKIISAEN
jgi:hypothetical protein